MIFVCVGVVYSGEYDVLWCYPECVSTPGKLKSLLGHGGNRTRDLWEQSIGLVSQRSRVRPQLAEHWTGIPKVAGSITTVTKQTFQLARCG